MKHGDIKTMKGDSIDSIFASVKATFMTGKCRNPIDENKMREIAEYFYKIINEGGMILNSPGWSVSKHVADTAGIIKINTIRDVLCTLGVSENIEYWCERLDLLNRVEYCEHSDDFEDPFLEED
jgi:hypothetical protein